MRNHITKQPNSNDKQIEEMIIKLNKEGCTDAKIFEELKYKGIATSSSYVYWKRRELGLPTQQKRQGNHRQELYDAYYTDEEIAEIEGVKKIVITTWRNKNNLPMIVRSNPKVRRIPVINKEREKELEDMMKAHDIDEPELPETKSKDYKYRFLKNIMTGYFDNSQ